ncbi:VRR-NUC domain-containing protein [Deinococcus sp. Leaf326]|uniref:VRR-NUC domain-containing protein n=1 Tax=Deinococcus sp. Leaf326 TaxID=1736338 RepID=UPI000A5815D5|nr:VRR-NUC domain-containing protein [Deinococcus sp. Leaf326]
MTRMSDADLRRYQRRHPHLFPDQPATPPPVAGYLAASQSNGYAKEADFQAAACAQLKARGWRVQEALKGSDSGGTVWYTPGWPDLQMYKPDGQRRMWFVELKQPGKKPTAKQLECHEYLRAAGFLVVVAWHLDAVLEAEATQ